MNMMSLLRHRPEPTRNKRGQCSESPRRLTRQLQELIMDKMRVGQHARGAFQTDEFGEQSRRSGRNCARDRRGRMYRFRRRTNIERLCHLETEEIGSGTQVGGGGPLTEATVSPATLQKKPGR